MGAGWWKPDARGEKEASENLRRIDVDRASARRVQHVCTDHHLRLHKRRVATMIEVHVRTDTERRDVADGRMAFSGTTQRQCNRPALATTSGGKVALVLGRSGGDRG